MIRTRHDLTEKTWFITFTCYQWIPLFDIANAYHSVYKWIKYIDDNYRIKTMAFVIMLNHVHIVIQLPDSVTNLNTIVGNGKRFMAYELIATLKEQKQEPILQRLSSACSEKERTKGQKHKAFEPSFDAKPIYTPDFLHQKIDYIHHNPVNGKWNLCNEFTDYPHSSAAFYVDHKPHKQVTITDYREFF